MLSESWAVKTLPELKVPVELKAMDPVPSIEQSMEKGEPVTEPAVIVTDDAVHPAQVFV